MGRWKPRYVELSEEQLKILVEKVKELDEELRRKGITRGSAKISL